MFRLGLAMGTDSIPVSCVPAFCVSRMVLGCDNDVDEFSDAMSSARRDGESTKCRGTGNGKIELGNISTDLDNSSLVLKGNFVSWNTTFLEIETECDSRSRTL